MQKKSDGGDRALQDAGREYSEYMTHPRRTDRTPTMPSFIVIGAAKCGTTSVAELLREHPDVFMSTPKEPHFFSRLTRYRQLWPWYRSLFDEADSFRAAGEASTSYTHPHRIEFVAPRIREVLPDCRLIYMVRHPIRRLESDWKMRLREERVPSSISAAADGHASLITFGLYWKHLQTYRKYFPDDQLLVVFLEDLADDPRRELARIFRHIKVDPSFVPENPGRKRNAAEQYRRKGELVATIRRIAGNARFRRMIPDPVVQTAKSILTDRFDPKPEWDAEALEMVRGYFRHDSHQLLWYCGKPREYWDFAE